MKLLRACLLLCLFLAKLSVAGAAPIVLDDHPQGLALQETGQLLWLTDDSGTLTLDEVLQPAHASRFQPVPPTQRHGDGAQPHWFKVVLEQRAATGDWVLATQTTALKDVRFHGPFDATGRALAPSVHTGLSQPFATRPLGSERYVMRLQLPGPGVYTVYVRLLGETAPSLGLSVWDTAEYLQWRQHKRLFDGICYGILIALLVYNLVLAGIFRDATYGFYIGQCTFALLTLASFNGHAAHYLWGHWPWWQERGHVVLPSLWLLFGALFARSFLDTRQVPWLDRLLLTWGLLAASVAVLGLLGQFDAAQTANEIVASTGALLATVAAVIILRRGFIPAQWYLGGQVLLFLSVLGVVLVNWRVIDAPFLLANGLQIGVAAELVVFAIALSQRISGLRTSQTALRLHAAHLAQAAATDPLTGLANRTGLARGATPVLADGAAHALMLLDLDRFKPINDTHGHDAGDAVLRVVATRLQAQFRADDIVARLGGDEFVVLLANPLPDEQLAALARRLDAAVRQPVDFQGQALTVGASTGIARSPQDGRTLTELIRCADQAMYQAKQTGSGHAFWSRATT
ncbi:MAG: sensor domain-containing diguanylate cyclase [Acidovorax soli]|uniref:diguanylate cyclase n=1 Tax=Acidovorax soli TaxID=592050 RepID=UPI0026F1E414|nr:diguanylate cyclase [Acidovorax soli]MCM2347125.1 sensor domain-containing diguanylate cyclase [Acidovorax soli]